MIGQKVAHYSITAAIGAGGMGQVYRATDTKLGREVALKVLPPEMAANPERLERFQREARAVAALNHPHVVTTYSVEQDDGVHFFTMELVDGESLDRLIPPGGMAVRRMLDIAGDLANALCAAHDQGIVHRDLKPANVMVTKAGTVRVLDFGLARITAPAEATLTLAEDQRTELRTSEGVVMGTMPYMSPEQLHGQALDHRADIFSFGIMLYEMASGERPFRGDSSIALASAILRDTPRPLPERRNDLPEGLVRIISRCLEKSAGDRFPSARDLRGALGGVVDGSPGRPVELAVVGEIAGRVQSDTNSGRAGADEGLGVAVMPLKFSGARSELEALAAGLTEDIVTGSHRWQGAGGPLRHGREPAASRHEAAPRRPARRCDDRSEFVGSNLRAYLDARISSSFAGSSAKAPRDATPCASFLAQKPDFPQTAREELGKWLAPDLLERHLEGLRKAGLEIAAENVSP
jgi:hypothetical protein